MADLTMNGRDVSCDMVSFAQELVRIKSFSGQEEQAAKAIAKKMEVLGYDSVRIDQLGNVVGKIGNGRKQILFESHTDTVKVHDEALWEAAPFSGEVIDGYLWGRGSVDMKSGISASIYAGAIAKKQGLLSGKTVTVSCSVFEEDCDGEGLKFVLQDTGMKPDFAIICEPSNNTIVGGHKGKAQIIIKTHGVSAHGSAPEKGVNAIYEMAEIIERVEETNLELMKKKGRRGTLVLARISSTGVSLNAVPAECEIYLDRRMVVGETEESVAVEMEKIIAGKNASWEIDTVHRTTWTGEAITYTPLHPAWEIERTHPLSSACMRAYKHVFGREHGEFGYWDFSTNAVALIPLGIPTIGFGPGEAKLAHTRDEKCALKQIMESCEFYVAMIGEI
jgi:putative selenium metabolism hydrolase